MTGSMGLAASMCCMAMAAMTTPRPRATSTGALATPATTRIYFAGDQNQLFGSDGNDWLGVNGTNNALVGGAGDEVWIGASGNSNTLDGAGRQRRAVRQWHGQLPVRRCRHRLARLLAATATRSTAAPATSGWAPPATATTCSAAMTATRCSRSAATSSTARLGDDWVGCSGNNNFLNGAQGNDYLAATGNGNTLDGGAGNDAAGRGGRTCRRPLRVPRRLRHATPISRLRAPRRRRHRRASTCNGFGLNFTTLQAYMADVGGNCVITLNGADILTVSGVLKAQFLATDFLF